MSNPARQVNVLPLRTLSDERLAELATNGHSDAFGTLYERYREALSRYCRSIVRDAEDAGDALQNTMVSVLRALKSHGPSGPVRPWLYRIAHNESVSILRRRHPHEELSVETPDQVDTELASLARYRLDALLTDLRSLPERQRGALVMRELGGLEYAEIADALDMSAVSARKHVFEARVALHDIADGRDTDCREIVRRISDGDGRVLRARSIRGHLRGCPSCSAFERGMRTRRATLGMIPAFPLISTGAALTAILHGGGVSTSGLAASGSVSGGSIAGGSIAGGSIAMGSMAAGSLLGGGSFAAIKGLVVAGALAVAGAGVVVGTSVSSHTPHAQSPTAMAVHAARRHHYRTRSTVVASVAPPVHLAAAPTLPPPSSRSTRVADVKVTSSARHTNAAAVYTPPKVRPFAADPSTQTPVASIPVASTTPTTTPATAPPETATSTPTAPTATTTSTGTTTGQTPATATTSWIDSIIESAMIGANADVAVAEAEAEQQLTKTGMSSTAASSTVQQLITQILSGMK